MNFALARNWWSLVARGVLGILLGVVAFVWPGVTIGALVLLFGAYALIDGVVSLAGALRAAEAHERWGALLLEGIMGVLAAAATILWPAITTLVLVYIIAAWAIITGVAEIAAAIRLRRHVAGEWLLGLAGVVSVVFGLLIAAVPVAGALAIAFWFGAYAFIFGIVLLTLGFRLRRWKHGVAGSSSFPMPVSQS
jgi:uncharacterized membrane protein HdeD (DUF308 family)